MVVAALLVRCALGRPVLFRDERAGRNGLPILVYKFRTMSEERDKDGQLLPDAERLVPVGRWLRALSIDELPQLLSVLQGHMSLVGPRPLPLSYVSRYSREQSRRLEVKPGLTGLAQVSGRNLLSWDERFALDLWYIDHWSLLLDVRILAKTLLFVVSRKGISASGEATMSEFLGEAAPCIEARQFEQSESSGPAVGRGSP